MPDKTNGPDANADVQWLTDANAELEARLEARTAALQQAEDRLAVSQRISKAGSWERNLNTGEVWWSKELYRIYGEDPDIFEPTYENFLERVHPEDRPRVERDMAAAWESGESYAAEIRVILADGTQKSMYSNMEVRCDEEGRPIWINGTAQDITESKKLQRALQESEARAQALLDANPDLIFRMASDGEYLDFRASKETHLSIPADQIIGRNMGDFFEPGFVRELQAHIDNALETGRVQLWQYQLPIQGEFRDLEARIIRSGENEIIKIVQDITEQTRLEREVIASSENERKRIGHDLHDGLGQELTAISLALQALSLKLDRESSPHAQAARNITVSTQNMIAEIRRFARQLAPIFSSKFGLNDALQALAKDVREYSNVECHAHGSYEHRTLDTDIAVHLYRIAQESINNAIRHSGAKNIELQYGRDGDSIFLEVLDDGTGIPTRDHRVDGIGLRSMRYRARMLRGRLDIAPRSQGGTRVFCSCPIPKA
jgi:two-component system CheB/CheR fusion protein